jgi:thiamine biosynthesis lipoprotein
MPDDLDIENEFSVKKKLFGKEVEFVAYNSDSSIALPVIEKAYVVGLRLSKIFNFYDKDSELSKLNGKREMKVSSELLRLIQVGISLALKTGAQYDITLGKLFIARKKGGSEPELKCSYKDIEINGNYVKLVHPDAMIDLGSIAKGYIVDSMAKALHEGGILCGLVDGRGDITVFGDCNHTLGVQHPRDKKKIISWISLKNCGVATSGDYNQYIKNYDKSHIINKKEVISITVVADDLATADAYATVLFVVDKQRRKELLMDATNIKAMTINEKLTIETFNGFEKLRVRGI